MFAPFFQTISNCSVFLAGRNRTSGAVGAGNCFSLLRQSLSLESVVFFLLFFLFLSVFSSERLEWLSSFRSFFGAVQLAFGSVLNFC